MTDITVSQLITWGVMLFGAVGAWFTYKNKVDNLQDKDIEQGRQIDAMWKWKESHDKESNQIRSEFQRELSRLEGSLLVNVEQFKQILGMLEDIKERLITLEKR